jgi:hypothetical protein
MSNTVTSAPSNPIRSAQQAEPQRGKDLPLVAAAVGLGAAAVTLLTGMPASTSAHVKRAGDERTERATDVVQKAGSGAGL